MRTICSVVLFVALPTAYAHAQIGGDCRHEADRAATVAAADARMLALEAGAGSLRIEGKPGLTSVVIRGRACASDADLLEDIKLEARRDGNTVVVHANVQDRDRNSLWDRGYARLDVVMEVPAGMNAEIEDGSGSMELLNLGEVEINDGSGEITGNRLGAAVIEDGSGEIDLSDIAGRVRIEDGSGEITLRGIGGTIEIDDGSGGIDIRQARGGVRISDGSGGIDVVDVDGDFIVDDDGSGGIAYDNVKGRVEIPRRKR